MIYTINYSYILRVMIPSVHHTFFKQKVGSLVKGDTCIQKSGTRVYWSKKKKNLNWIVTEWGLVFETVTLHTPNSKVLDDQE